MKKLITMVVVLAMLTMMSTTAFAATDSGTTITGTSAVTGGTVGFGVFTAITLDGTSKTATATWTIANIVDARGTGAGWNETLTLTPLKEFTTIYVVDGKTLAASSIKVTTAPIVTLVDATSSPANTITVVSTTTALDTGTPVKLLSAALDGGMGSYAVSSMTATLTVPASAYAKVYKTDATVALVTAP